MNRRMALHVEFLLLLALVAGSAYGTDRFKANNVDNLNLASSWDTSPGTGDVAVWNSTVTAANTTSLGASLSWAGIRIADPGGLVTINWISGQTLTLGTSGIDLSGATQDLTINSDTILGGNQSWTVPSGRTLTTASLLNFNGKTLTVGGAGNTTVNSWGYSAGQSGTLTKTGSGTLTTISNLRLGGDGDVGYVNVQGGVLSVQAPQLFDGNNYSSGGNITVTGGGVLELQNWNYGSGYNLGQLRANANAVVIDNGTIRMTGTDSYGRGFTINSGGATLEAASGANWTLPSDVAISLSGNPNLTLAGSGAGTFGKVYSGSGTLTKSGSGTWVINNNNTSTGNARITGGTVTVNAGKALAWAGAGKAGTDTLVISGGAVLEVSEWGAWSSTGPFGELNYNDGYLRVNNGTIRMMATPVAGASRGINIDTGGATLEAVSGVTWNLGVSGNHLYGAGSLTIGNAGTVTMDTQITISGSLIKTGAGTLVIGANNTLTGNVQINGGTVTVNAGKSMAWAGASKAATDSLVISGGATLEIPAWGAWGTTGPFGQLNYNNGYLRVNNGTIRMTATDNAAANRGINIDTGGVTLEVVSGASWTIGASANTLYGTGPLTLGGAGSGLANIPITTSGGLTKTGAGTWTLGGANTFSGTTTIGGGVLVLGNSSALSGSTLDYNSSGGTISFGSLTSATLGGLKGSQDLQLVNGSSAALALTAGANGQSTTYAGILSGAGSLLKSGAGTLSLNGVNTYGGDTTISAGALAIGGSGQLGSGNYAGNITDNATLIYGSSASQTLSGTISGGSGALVQNGSGLLTLTGPNSYGGLTTVSGSTLQIGAGGASGAPGSGGMTVISGGSLAFNRTGSPVFSGAVTLNTGTITQMVASAVTLSGNLTLSGSATVGVASGGTLNLGSGVAGSQIVFNGMTLTVAGAGNTVLNAWGNEQAGTLTKAGSGTLTTTSNPRLLNSNVNLQGGVLSVQGAQLYSGNYSSSGAITISGGAALELQNWSYGSTYNLGGLRANANALYLDNGTIRMTGTDNYGRGFTINSGGATLEAAAGANWTLPNDVAIGVSGNPNLTLTGAGRGTFGKAFSGTGTWTKSGSGTWTLTGNSQLASGATVLVNEGVLEVSGGKLWGPSYVNASWVVIASGATLRLGSWGYDTAGSLGTLATYTWRVGLNGGTIEITGGSESAGRPMQVGAQGGTFLVTNAATTLTWPDTASNDNLLNGTVRFGGAGNIAMSETMSGVGGVIKQGTGTLTLAGDSTYGGSTVVEGGMLLLNDGNAADRGGSTIASTDVRVSPGATLRLGASCQLGWSNGATITLDGGTLSTANNIHNYLTHLVLTNGAAVSLGTGGFSGTWQSFAFNDVVSRASTSGNAISGGQVEIGAAAVNVEDGSAATDLSIGTVLSNRTPANGSLTKSGAGVLELSGVNRYTGATTINGGTLRVTGQIYRTDGFFGGAGTTYVYVNSGAALEVGQFEYGDPNPLSQLRNNYYAINVNGGRIRITQTGSAYRAFTIGANGATIEVASGCTYTKSGGSVGGQNILYNTGNGSLTLDGDGTGDMQDALGTYGTWGAAAGVVKTGAGSWTLSGANTYSGGTIVSNGTLIVSSGGTAGAGDVLVRNGAALTLQGTTTIGNTARLTLETGASATLNYSGEEVVGELYLGLTRKWKGVWGAVGSGAPNESSQLFGTGFIRVSVGAPHPATLIQFI